MLKMLKFWGGEPLLHPHVYECLNIIKESNISDTISICTNGILLERVDDRIFDIIKILEVSLYQNDNKSKEDIINSVKVIAERHPKLQCTLREWEYFREVNVSTPIKDKTLIERIYNTCLVANVYKCISVDDGCLYRCPLQMMNAKSDKDKGLNLKEITSYNDILKFLENNSPIKSCETCLGSVGKYFRHQQIKRSDFKKFEVGAVENKIDFEQLKTLEYQLCNREQE